MRSKVAQRILDKTSPDVKIFVRLYADIVVRVNELMEEKGWTQKELAERMDKKPSEINRWLKGEHNFTLRSIAKLEAELGEPILSVFRSNRNIKKKIMWVRRILYLPLKWNYSNFIFIYFFSDFHDSVFQIW